MNASLPRQQPGGPGALSSAPILGITSILSE
jgi:hypothetical protein